LIKNEEVISSKIGKFGNANEKASIGKPCEDCSCGKKEYLY
jgi:hypothetical protein